MTVTTKPTTQKAFVLPPQGVCRAKQILELLPVGRTTFYKMVRNGDFPKPIRMGENISVWRNAEVLAWLEQLEG